MPLLIVLNICGIRKIILNDYCISKVLKYVSRKIISAE